MNSILNEENILRTSKKILGVAGLAGLALLCAGAIQAQSKTSQTESSATPSGTAIPGTPASVKPASADSSSATTLPEVATQKTTQAVAQNPPAKKSAPKGQSEGIKVHGHWTIEVRNPDGKVVTHREFENSLQDSTLISSLLGHTATPGGFSILLLGNCGQIDYPEDTVPGGVGPGCILYEPDSPFATLDPIDFDTLTYGVNCAAAATPSCFGVLSTSTSNGTIILQGTFQAASGLPSFANITAVYAQEYTCAPSVSTTNCVTQATSVNGNGFRDSVAVTGTTLSTAVPISSNQTIFVMVTISFQ